jgi:hypothetical protein
MLRSKLIRAAVLTVLAGSALLACGDDDGGGGAIEENVVRPGITAMEQASGLACGTDGEAVRMAVESYTMLEGSPPPNEAALVATGYLREESELWDVVDGELVAAVADCGAANTITAPASEVGDIVTSTEPAMSAEDLMATLTEEDIAEVGGLECAQELAGIAAAGMRFASERGEDPESIEQLLETGYLEQTPQLWALEDDDLQPADGSPCVVPGQGDGEAVQSCESDLKTLEVAVEAYRAMLGAGQNPDEADLVAEGMLRGESDGFDVVDGEVIAVGDGPCAGFPVSPDAG